MTKAVKMWAVKKPLGFHVVNNTAETPADIRASYQDWAREYRRGYRIVRVQVTEVKRKRKGGAK